MRLEDIGFYTLTDERAATVTPFTPLMRCELLVTDSCNFRCPYCRSSHSGGDMSWPDAERILDLWMSDGLVNLRFSGGEPTLWPHILRAVHHAKHGGVKRIAMSTNGSAPWDVYQMLARIGVDDFSVSLDACCAATGGKMSGRKKAWEHVVANIRKLSEVAYVTVGIVVTEDNAAEAPEVIALAHDLGVSDIRVIPAAQNGNACTFNADESLTDVHPILGYRLANMRAGRPFRGLRESDSHRCALVLDDMAVKDGKHYPCIIYLREGGREIGDLDENTRTQRATWSATHDPHRDPICQANCLDVCVDYNNRYRDLHVASQDGPDGLRLADVVRGHHS